MKNQQEESLRFKELRSYFLERLQALPLEIEVEGHSTSCLPHIIGVTIKGIEGQYTMLECNRRGIAISTGSACQVGKQEPSKTMLAIGKRMKRQNNMSASLSDNKQRKIKLILLFMHYTQLEINFIEVLNHNETK